jgi:transcription elongation factor Elf1
MRIRKPRIDLIGFENDYGTVVRTDSPSKWVIQCKSCGQEHEQDSRQIQNNSNPRSCQNFEPYNKVFQDRRDGIIRRQYGITLQEYNDMLEKQDYKCAICGNEDEVEGRKLAIDHCHTSGAVRGLLCGKCNRGLGLFYDNQDLLEKAKQYLYANAR